MTLSFYRHGQGEVGVIAAHSWVASGVSFAPLLEHLDSENFSWVFPSFEGYGLSPAPAGSAEIASLGRDLIGLADYLGWEQFHLVGHSMGGQAVQSVLSDANTSSRVRSATLISAVPSHGFPVEGTTRQVFENAALSSDGMKQVLLNLAAGTEPQGIAQYILALSQATTTPDTLRAYLRAWTQDDVSAGVDTYTGQVLVLSGDEDPALGPAVARGIASVFSNARHESLAGVGHFPPLEAPARVAELVTSHIVEAQAARTGTEA